MRQCSVGMQEALTHLGACTKPYMVLNMSLVDECFVVATLETFLCSPTWFSNTRVRACAYKIMLVAVLTPFAYMYIYIWLHILASHMYSHCNAMLAFNSRSHLMLWSRQTLCPLLVVKVLGIMLRNRCWPTTFHTITNRDAYKIMLVAVLAPFVYIHI